MNDDTPDYKPRADNPNAPRGLITPVARCTLPPAGWRCTRGGGHDGPCATVAEHEAFKAALTIDQIADFFRVPREMLDPLPALDPDRPGAAMLKNWIDRHNAFTTWAASRGSQVSPDMALPSKTSEEHDRAAEALERYGTGVLPWSCRVPSNQPLNIIADAMQAELNELRPLVALARATPQHSVTEHASIGDDPKFRELLHAVQALFIGDATDAKRKLVALIDSRTQPLASTAAPDALQRAESALLKNGFTRLDDLWIPPTASTAADRVTVERIKASAQRNANASNDGFFWNFDGEGFDTFVAEMLALMDTTKEPK